MVQNIITHLPNIILALAFVFAFGYLLVAGLCMLFGRAATIGGPEHKDPTDKELKDIKKKLAARNCYCSEYIGDGQCKENLTADEVARRIRRMDDYMDRSDEKQK